MNAADRSTRAGASLVTIAPTPQQRQVIDAAGNFLLLACPGSGKTRSAAHRAARLVTPPSPTRIAVCSYTNVGAQRLAAALAADHGITLAERHFLGTIHSLLLRYVVYPFAHLRGAQRGPTVREGPWPDVAVLGDNTKRLSIDKFRYRADGSLVLTGKPRTIRDSDEDILASVRQEVMRRKRQIFQHTGALSADDAIWVALQLLRASPDICRSVASRFDEIILDEAQDTSELQLACVEQLHSTGQLTSLVMIGDFEQSIYSFQGASAEGCRNLAATSGLREIVLDENHRSSQHICDIAVHFSSRERADRAVGPHAACPIRPEIVLYPPSDPHACMQLFSDRLDHHGIAPRSAAILVRNGSMADLLNGADTSLQLRERARTLGRIACKLADGTLTRHDVEAVERIVAYCALGTVHRDELDKSDRRLLRRQTFRLLNALPAPRGDLTVWMRAAAAALHAAAEAVATPVQHTGARTLPTPASLTGLETSAVFAASPPQPPVQTVHSIKGEDREAVMVVIRRRHAADPGSQLELWEAAADGTTIDHDKQEERRVMFVALTRAQRFCLVAFPDDQRGRRVATACLNLGFIESPR